MNMKTTQKEPIPAPQDKKTLSPGSPDLGQCDTPTDATVDAQARKSANIAVTEEADRPQKTGSLTPTSEEIIPPRKVARGLAATISTTKLKQAIWRRALLTANRFRVIRTIDIAVCCFAERPYKAALTAGQRAVRGLVKADLLKRYRTDRFQTVYGLSQKGVAWLDEAGHDASSSVRRVS